MIFDSYVSLLQATELTKIQCQILSLWQMTWGHLCHNNTIISSQVPIGSHEHSRGSPWKTLHTAPILLLFCCRVHHNLVPARRCLWSIFKSPSSWFPVRYATLSSAWSYAELFAISRIKAISLVGDEENKEGLQLLDSHRRASVLSVSDNRKISS